jgi:hypothetical protein
MNISPVLAIFATNAPPFAAQTFRHRLYDRRTRVAMARLLDENRVVF